ncbi:MATE family efflux transporter [Solitalea canadensis]|uniref:Multidrug-efflux transporter n=1 Tax=Solitalea canadensis (strain ATCC 29591 / DSM 3403 / JCM 21819 / LMG 8368 / NBRC 15130 / NCIMB 12057 / USAM 9D) TaxID=929556 RepID=H8KR52_SOLCM|nr:MATE family efflux transporter [Solitalea canadensis]AFD07258.1 putative efflux protein, MATE family [Solitalea canadensis DSM 3403]
MSTTLTAAADKISFREINRLAIPALLAGVVEPIISLTDLVIVGRIPFDKTEIIAAVGIASSLISALTWILAQTSSAISSIVARYLGNKRLFELDSLVVQTFIFSLLMSAVVTLTTKYFSVEIFKLYNANGKILSYAVEYFNIRVWGFPLSLITFTLYGVFRGLQNTVWSMYIGLAGGFLHIFLDIFLVFGVKGLIPPMNIEGAAYASLFTQILMFLVALYFFITKTPFKLRPGKYIHAELFNLIKLSINLFFRAAALNFAFYLANRYATGYGKEQIAAHAIIANIFLFVAFVIDGYGNAGNAISGKLLGSKDFRKLWLLGIDLNKIVIAIAVGIMVICGVCYSFIGKLFTSDPHVLKLFYQTFWILLLMLPINAVAFTFDAIYKGLGEAVFLRNLLIGATFIGFIPALWLFDKLNMQLYGIWTAFTIFMLYRAIGSYWKFKAKYLVS